MVPHNGSVPVPPWSSTPAVRISPASTTGTDHWYLRVTGSRSTTQASSGTSTTCMLTTTVDNPAPNSAIACVHSNMSPANNAPATMERTGRSGGPSRRRSRAARNSNGGSASRQR
jgi:hypothetical protein